ncbi:MAG: type II toxin-antitoxin system VapC family toxin [Cyanobacteria bacterium J06635_1]
MRLLLDTQCWLWWFAQPERLNEDVIETIADEANEIWFSVASVWEMGIKVSIGKLPLPEPIGAYVSTRMSQLGAKSLQITNAHALQVATLPLHHRDPFDRMLIAQAQVEEMTLVSADSALRQYDVALLWAASA